MDKNVFLTRENKEKEYNHREHKNYFDPKKLVTINLNSTYWEKI